jgi:hypothetical protein
MRNFHASAEVDAQGRAWPVCACGSPYGFTRGVEIRLHCARCGHNADARAFGLAGPDLKRRGRGANDAAGPDAS